MVKVIDNLYVGGIDDCSAPIKHKIHACKLPCFIASKSVNYLVNEKSNDLFLNIIDTDAKQITEYLNVIFESAFRFIDAHINDGVAIHCNEGKSRAPSIAMAYMAARNKIDNKTFATAANAFVKLYDNYWVHRGLEKYMHDNWENILKY